MNTTAVSTVENSMAEPIFMVDPTKDGLAWFCANIVDHQVNLGRARRSALLTGLASGVPAEILKGKGYEDRRDWWHRDAGVKSG